MTNEERWESIPVGKENAISYGDLCAMWKMGERAARNLLHRLSYFDNGDDYVLIRSAHGRGFYRTDNTEEIQRFRQECLNRGRNCFAPVKKINRILNNDNRQLDIINNLRNIRKEREMSQKQVCDFMRVIDRGFDEPLLSKMENGVVLPTPKQLERLAEYYGVTAHELIDLDTCLSMMI